MYDTSRKPSPARVAKKWKKLPPGWTDNSVEKFWDTLTGDSPEHKVWDCVEKMTKPFGDGAGAFCGGLADWQIPGWRKKNMKESPEARSDAKSYWKKKIKNKKGNATRVALASASRVASRFNNQVASSKPWGNDDPAHGVYDYIINRSNMGEIPSDYIRHHERIAKNTLKIMERTLGVKVLDQRLRKDRYGGGWSVGMKVLEADIETATGELLNLVWQDRWSDWFSPMRNWYENPGASKPTGLRYGGEFHWIDKGDKARPLKASMFRKA